MRAGFPPNPPGPLGAHKISSIAVFQALACSISERHLFRIFTKRSLGSPPDFNSEINLSPSDLGKKLTSTKNLLRGVSFCGRFSI